MSDRLAFLRAIRADPDDDTARLVFADWLDERDDPLGGFIRLQIELEPVRFRIDDPRAVALHAREDELLRRHRDEWVGDVPHFPNPADFGPVFRRGLPDYACLSLDTFLAHGAALFAACPTLREVALYGLANRCSELTLSPLLANLDTLEIADWLTEDDAISLSVSPHLDRISHFKLWVGGEPYFLRELVKQAGKNWPREIELVQVYGGVAAGAEAHPLNDEADALAREANAQLGRPVVHVTRPFERLFPLDGDLGYNLCAGHLPDGTPALAAGHSRFMMLFKFDAAGALLDGLGLRAGPLPELLSEALSLEEQLALAAASVANAALSLEEQLALGAAFANWVGEELRLAPGLIRVREFGTLYLGVEPWDVDHQVRFRSPGAGPPDGRSEADWRDVPGKAVGWRENQNFVVRWDRDHWADWRGRLLRP